MPSNLLSRKSFSTKTPAICHPPPLPPAFPPPDFKKTSFRAVVGWTTCIELNALQTNEHFWLEWANFTRWNGETHPPDKYPKVQIIFYVKFAPLRFDLRCWHFPTGPTGYQYVEFMGYPFKKEKPLDTSWVGKCWPSMHDKMQIRVQQKPF